MPEIIQDNDPYTQPSFSLANRMRRFLWNFACLLLFRPTPRQLNAWRASVLRMFGAKIGQGCNVRATAKIWAPWNLEMGDFSAIADDVNVYSMAVIKLGSKVVVSQGAHLCSGTHDYESENFQLYARPITIGDSAWICTECFIGPGVTVGEGAVVGARAVATKDVPAWTVCAGNPCKPIKPRVIRDA
ncbi:MAG: WcaF family extracellular polysaccharide biosynthesis acetyltransferase [Armatimonadetes bacterium]|nr:WcaF family extracellular polysaccharide biosynthesis acetyltransferase [Armatimonadota bacterium]